MNKSKIIYAYCCDFAAFRGEGILAQNFINLILKNFNKRIAIITPDKIFRLKKLTNKKDKINHSFLYKYSSPFIGILVIWYYHLKGFQTCYVNFLPLWNTFLFIFLPKKTILGPITGSNYHGNRANIKSKIRYKILTLLYKLSLYFIKIKKKNVFFLLIY